MEGGVAVRARDLAKSYGSEKAVRGVSLEVRRSTLYGFLGPNGAGKTTARMPSGLARRVTAEVAGVEVISHPRIRGLLGGGRASQAPEPGAVTYE